MPLFDEQCTRTVLNNTILFKVNFIAFIISYPERIRYVFSFFFLINVSIKKKSDKSSKLQLY